jgi:hypothetical protein
MGFDEYRWRRLFNDRRYDRRHELMAFAFGPAASVASIAALKCTLDLICDDSASLNSNCVRRIQLRVAYEQRILACSIIESANRRPSITRSLIGGGFEPWAWATPRAFCIDFKLPINYIVSLHMVYSCNELRSLSANNGRGHRGWSECIRSSLSSTQRNQL